MIIYACSPFPGPRLCRWRRQYWSREYWWRHGCWWMNRRPPHSILPGGEKCRVVPPVTWRIFRSVFGMFIVTAATWQKCNKVYPLLPLFSAWKRIVATLRKNRTSKLCGESICLPVFFMREEYWSQYHYIAKDKTSKTCGEDIYFLASVWEKNLATNWRWTWFI